MINMEANVIHPMMTIINQMCRKQIFVSIPVLCLAFLSLGQVEENGESSSIVLYRRLLQQKRIDQQSAIKQIMSIDNYEKQYKLVKMLLDKITTVLNDNKMTLLKLGYTPGDPFPEEENVKDALSMVVENVAFMGDIVLRLPDITHGLLKKNQDLDSLVKWGVQFVNETNILVSSDVMLLNLMGQELDIIPKSADYVNPYKQKAQAKEEKESEQKESKAKKKKKERQRGPRLQGGRNEL